MTKLLYLLNARIPTPRAYGLQVMKMCEAFAAAGAEVELVVPTRRADEANEPFGYYAVQKNFKLTKLAVPDFLHYGPLGFFMSALIFSEKARWLKSFWKADIVYSRDALVLVQYLLLGRPLIFEAHAKPSFISRIVARRAKRVVVISQGLKNAYHAVGVLEERMIVAPDAVDEHLFDNVPSREEARAILGFPPEVRIALYAGHLYARKGADTAAAAAFETPGVLFVFVGGTEEDVLAFKSRWGTNKDISIVGQVAHEKVPLYLRAADVLILPNSGKDEDSAHFTSPMKLFEYMASGTPIVASEVPSIREILSEASAFLVAPDDLHALAEGITETLAHPESAQARATHARQDSARYTWSNRARSILFQK